MFFKKKYESININEIKDLKDINIIDVRTKEEYQEESIKNTKNIELKTLLQDPSKYLDKDKKYYIMCHSGVRSLMACAQLSKLEYDVVNLSGGISNYKK